MIVGPFVKIEEMDEGSAFLVTYSRGEVHSHHAFGSLDRAQGFAEGFIGKQLAQITPTVWWATA